MSVKIRICASVDASADEVWEAWTKPEHITNWNFASDDWHCPSVENDLRIGGKFSWRMETKDGSTGFDFEGIYKDVILNEKIKYGLEDGREVMIEFTKIDGHIEVAELFDTEDVNTAEQQRQGWQAILNNFKNYVESMS